MSLAASRQNGQVSVGSSSTALVPENRNRLGLIVSVNSGGTNQNCWLAFQVGNAVPAAVVNSGVRVAAGNALTLIGDDVFRGGINIIGAAAGPTTISITEF